MKYLQIALITLLLVAVSACATDSQRSASGSKDDSHAHHGSSGHSH